MFPLGSRGRATVPGSPRDALIGDNERCIACGAGSRQNALLVRKVVAGNDLVLCLDYAACCTRYRGGATPDEHAELMAVSS